jgi:hypothetical protein
MIVIRVISSENYRCNFNIRRQIIIVPIITIKEMMAVIIHRNPRIKKYGIISYMSNETSCMKVSISFVCSE